MAPMECTWTEDGDFRSAEDSYALKPLSVGRLRFETSYKRAIEWCLVDRTPTPRPSSLTVTPSGMLYAMAHSDDMTRTVRSSSMEAR